MKTRKLIMALLISSVAFVSCSNEDEEVKPTYQPGEVVKTEFTIALNGKKVGTRQSNEVVQGQNDPVFRGIQNVCLIPYVISGTSVASTDKRLGNENINLPQAGAIPTISGPNTITGLNSSSSSQLYKDVAIPLGTNAFLFYGEATRDSYSEKERGVIVAHNLADGNPSTIQFTLQPIYPDGDVTNTATYLVQYLTAIANTTDWASIDVSDPLGYLRKQFTSMTAGSSANVLALVQDLYTTLLGNTTDMSNAIKQTITTWTYEGSNMAVTAITDGVLTFADALKGWPSTEKNLPDGAAYIKWEDSQFKPIVAKDNGIMNNPALDSYTYPASLYYIANSPLKVQNESMADKYTTLDWTNLLAAYTDGTQVGLATRSIIISNQIQYAVARLDVKAQANAATLNDFKEKSITLESTTFPITGVLVGGQAPVDFSFMPMYTPTPHTIYDSDVVANWALTSTSSSTVNHTLVLTSYGENDEGKVRVAIELTNNSGEDFNGFGGALIPAGCKFYLVGELNAKDNTSVLDKNGAPIKRVFLQDYITTANFTIKSLKNAYNVVPDLRLPELELGLGVDLDWTPGLNLGVEIE